LMYKDLSINSLHSGLITKSAFLKFTELPGIIGQRTYKYATTTPKDGLNFDQFISLIAKFTKADAEEMYKALFEILDTDNDGFFGLEDLITLLRTFETSEIIPELLRESPGFEDKVLNILSDEEVGSNNGSTTSIATLESSGEIPTITLESLAYISSTKITRIAMKMLKNGGFEKDAKLGFVDFSKFLKRHPCFTTEFQKAMKRHYWSGDSQEPTKKSLPTHSEEISGAKTGTDFFLQQDEINMAGVLKKKGAKSGKTKRRYYIIKGNMMYYYLKKGDSIPRGVMYLPNKLMSLSPNKGKNGIKVYSQDSTSEYKTLFASSEEECEQWYKCMLTGANNEDINLKYKMKETLGVGKFSTVRKGYLRSDETQKVAIKIVSKKDITEKEKEYILNEVSILKLINHPNIPKVHGIYETNEKIFIAMDLIKDGELFEYLIESRRLPTEEANKAVSQLLKVMKYLKELKIMHRDIKTENMMVNLGKGGKLKKVYLIDFGLAKFTDSSVEVTQKLGTMGYCAPEVILKEKYGESVDMWSAGIVYYLLLAGKLPFDGKTNESISDRTVNSPLSLEDKVFKELDLKVHQFLESSLIKDPKERLTVEDGLALVSTF